MHYLFENNKYLDKSDLSRQSARYNLYNLLTQYLTTGSLQVYTVDSQKNEVKFLLYCSDSNQSPIFFVFLDQNDVMQLMEIKIALQQNTKLDQLAFKRVQGWDIAYGVPEGTKLIVGSNVFAEPQIQHFSGGIGIKCMCDPVES